MKISIITVCFNSEKTISNTFDSVSTQTYDNIEYIVVDGRSTDATLEIIHGRKELIDKFITEPDKGLYDAMNKGIAMATGEYIGIINADDVFYDDNVIADVARFLRNKNIDACIGDIVQIRENGHLFRSYSSKSWEPSKLAIGYMPPHPSIFLKKEVFEKYGNYILNLKIGADYELITRVFLKNKISWKYSNIITHKMLIGGLSSSGWKSYIHNTKDICTALKLNSIKFNVWKVRARIVWKILDLIRHFRN